MFTYDFIWHWVGGGYEGNQYTAEKVEPTPIDGNPVWARGYNHSPTPCSDFADQGDWLGQMPVDVTWLVRPTRNEYSISGGGGAPSFTPYSMSWSTDRQESGDLYGFSSKKQLKISDEPPDEGYFMGSPLESGAVFYRDMSAIVFGDSEYFNFSEYEETSTKRKFSGYCSLVDHKAAHTFIGVINE